MNLWEIPDTTVYPGATQADWEAVESTLGPVPVALKDLWKHANGVLFASGMHIHGTTIIAERNLTWGVTEFSPGYLAVGDDSGGRIFLMRAEPDARGVLQAYSGDLDPAFFEHVADNLLAWVEQGCTRDEV